MTDDPALTLCERLSLQPRDRVGCARPSTRQPDRKCRAPKCECGPSGDLLAIREALAAERDRCADIAESSRRHHDRKYGEATDRAMQQSHLSQSLASSKIAAAIRNQKGDAP